MTFDLAALAGHDEYDIDVPAKWASPQRIIEFYDEAGMDYGHWSPGFNMHLGYYRRGMRLLDREKMLEQMNLEVALRLDQPFDGKSLLIDLGCGAGAIARTVAKYYSNSTIKGITNVPSQIRLATRLNKVDNLHNQIEIIGGEHKSLPIDNGTADGVWAVESACYADGAGKVDLTREMARVLKAGGRFAVADCFIKEPEKEFNFFIKRCYSAVCRYWALPEMPVLESFVEALERQGFTDIIVEDISWRVAPSLAHAPFAVMSFILKKMLAREPLKRHSINNLKASLLALALGLNRTKFSYCLISGSAP